MSRYASCWANYRGDCDRGMSAEHLISKALFPEQIVYVSGMDWCKGQEKRVGINSLARKFLCAHHNNSLSPADEAAVVAIDAFYSGTAKDEINRLLLERQLVKTAINLSIGCSRHIGVGMNDSNPGKPSPYLLAVAFGQLSFSHKMGAYFFFPAGPYIYRKGGLFFVPFQQEDKIGGFLFELRGQYVFLNLFAGHSPSALGEIIKDLLPEHVTCAELVYRPEDITVNEVNGPTGHIRINWSN